jgi:hypothetical protein
MGGEPRTAGTKIAPQLLGIAALAVLFIAFIRSDRAQETPESPFRQAARRLRIGMTSEEANAAINLGEIAGASGSLRYWDQFWFDEARDEVLSLHFETRGSLLAGTTIDRLTNWRVERTGR